MKLSIRKTEVLKNIVAKFIEKAEPISSASIAHCSGIDFSPATIRKEMAELEEMGYLTHPHTSAGRIPTDMGYRFYVDNFMQEEVIKLFDEDESKFPIDIEPSKDMGIEIILQKSTEILSRFTNYLSMIVAPSIKQARFRHIELLKFDTYTYLLVLITDSGTVFKRNFQIEGQYNDIDLQRAANILNSRLREKHIMGIDVGKDLLISDSDNHLIFLLNKVVSIIKSCQEDSTLHNRIFVHGTSFMVQQPEFIDLKKIYKIIEVLENEYMLMELLLNFTSDNEIIIKIGSEIHGKQTDDLSLIASKYKMKNNSFGSIGILGPKRMDYFKVINVLGSFRKNLSKFLNSNT